MSVIADRIAPTVRLGSHLGRGFGRIGADTLIGRLRPLPRTIGDLDAAAVSSLFGRTVTSVSLIDGDAGTSSRARLALTGDDVPASVFVKMAAETVGHPSDGRTRQPRRDRDALLPPAVTGADGRTPLLRLGVRPVHGQIRAHAGGPSRPVEISLRVPRHPASDRRGPGRPRRRTAGPPARDVLGPPARTHWSRSAGLALHGLR